VRLTGPIAAINLDYGADAAVVDGGEHLVLVGHQRARGAGGELARGAGRAGAGFHRALLSGPFLEATIEHGGIVVADSIDLDLMAGRVLGLIGPNGAGKSTLLNCFVGRLIPDTGSVTFNGTSLIGLQPHQINQTGVVRVFQTPEIFGELSLLDNVLIPTLAHLVCAKTATCEFGCEIHRRNKSSDCTALRITRVLSPSSPISAAALYTNDQAFSVRRTAPDINNASSLRFASNDFTFLSVLFKP
jgi:hypothetical protein